MPKSHAGVLENYWELYRMITHEVNDYVILDIELRLLLHNG